MRKWTIGILLVCCIFFLSPAQVGAELFGPEGHFPMTPGLSWTYAVEALTTNDQGEQVMMAATEDVTSLGSAFHSVIVFSNGNTTTSDNNYILDGGLSIGSTKIVMTSQWNIEGILIKTTSTTNNAYSPPQITFPSSVATGTSESSAGSCTTELVTVTETPYGSYTNPASNLSSQTARVVVEGTETVTVGAGTFTAVKVVTTIIVTEGEASSTYTITSWYAKGVGLVKMDSVNMKRALVAWKKTVEAELGCPDGKCKPSGGASAPGSGYGVPVWSVNMANLNLFVTDTPLWYRSPIGPPVEVTLSYNSQSTTARFEPVGRKWQLNYESYLYADQATGDVTIYMPDGRRDVYTKDTVGYKPPYRVFNDLRMTRQGGLMEGSDYELTFPDGTIYAYQVPLGSLLWAFLSEIRDPQGNTLSLQWTGLSPWGGKLMSIKDAMDRTTQFSHDSLNRITSILDPFGRFATFTYNEEGDLTAIRDMGRYTTTFTYDSNGIMQSMNQGINQWTFQPDENSLTVTDALGTEKFTLDAAQGSGSYQGAGGGTGDTYAYTQATAPDGRHKDVTGFQTPEGVGFAFSHDDRGNLLTDTLKAAGGDETATFTYNSKGKVTSVRDARGALTSLTYASNQVDLVRLEDGLGAMTAAYDGQHNIVSLNDRTGATKSYVYNEFGQVTQTVDALGALTNFVYNTNHQLIRVERAGTTVSTYQYDAIGRVSAYTDVNGYTLRYAYNDLDDLVSITYPDDRQTLYNRSATIPHLIESVTDRAGKTTHYRYNAHKQLDRITDPEGGETRYVYNTAGHATQLVDQNGNSTYFEYNRDNRLVKKRFADGSSQNFTYTNGRLIRSTNARGITTDYTYDRNGNLLTIRYSDDTPGVTITYDDYNRPVVLEDGLGVHRKSYDAASRVTSIDGPWDNDTLTFGYDARGRKISESLEKGMTMTYNHDDLDRLTALTGGGLTYTYAYQGGTALLEKLERSDGSGTEYGYDSPMKRLLRLTNLNRSGDVLNEYRLSFDVLGQPTGETIVNGPGHQFTRLETDIYTYNTLNQPITLDGTANVFAYDADGNMTAGLTENGRPFTADYDAENRLISIQFTDGNGILRRQEYRYGADGLIGLRKRYANGALTDELRILRQGGKILQERNGANDAERTYLWGLAQTGGVGALLALQQQGETYQCFTNTRGDITTILDSAGAVAAAYADDPFGVPLAATGSLDQPIRYSTKRLDEGTGFYDFGYRFYSPRFGRWLSRDPMAEQASVNLYSFVHNNPLTRFDPFGADDFSWMRPEHRAQAEAQLAEMRAAREAEKTWGNKISEGLSNGFRWIGDKIKDNPEVAKKVVDTVVDTALESNEYTKAGKEWNDRIHKGIEIADDLRDVEIALKDKDPASGLTLLKKLVKYTCGRIPVVGSAYSDILTKGIETVETAPGGVQASRRQHDAGTVNIGAARQMRQVE